MSNLNNNTQQIQNLINKINSLPSAGGGGLDTSDATATVDEIFAGETAYVKGGKVTGTFTIDSELTEQNDLISQISALVATKANPQGGTNTNDATATESDIVSGKTAYVKGSKITGIIPTQSAKIVTPSTSSQTAVSKGVYTTGAITVGAIPSDYIVTEEITAQDNLITQIQTALQGKASGGGSSGGGSINTCTVTITEFSNSCRYAYSAVENGEIVAKGNVINYGASPGTLTNVVCGSAIFISNDYYMNGVTIGGGVEFTSGTPARIGMLFRAPTTQGASGTINIYDND